MISVLSPVVLILVYLIIISVISLLTEFHWLPSEESLFSCHHLIYFPESPFALFSLSVCRLLLLFVFESSPDSLFLFKVSTTLKSERGCTFYFKTVINTSLLFFLNKIKQNKFRFRLRTTATYPFAILEFEMITVWFTLDREIFTALSGKIIIISWSAVFSLSNEWLFLACVMQKKMLLLKKMFTVQHSRRELSTLKSWMVGIYAFDWMASNARVDNSGFVTLTRDVEL